MMGSVAKRPAYPTDVREQALELYGEHGPAEAARQTGVRRATVSMWAKRAGVTVTSERTARAIETARMAAERRRAELVEDLLAIATMRAKHLRAGLQPGDAEQARVMTMALDKYLVLSGQATERTEVVTADVTALLDGLLDLRRGVDAPTAPTEPRIRVVNGSAASVP